MKSIKKNRYEKKIISDLHVEKSQLPDYVLEINYLIQ